jgi:hypothetical protein
MKNKPTIRLELNYWNDKTQKEKDKAILWLVDLLGRMSKGEKFYRGFWGEHYK